MNICLEVDKYQSYRENDTTSRLKTLDKRGKIVFFNERDLNL